MGLTETGVARKLDRRSNGMLMSPEEFDAVDRYDDRLCYELIRGVVIVTPIPSEAESDPNEELGYLLRHFKRNHPQGSSLDKTLVERYIAVPGSRRRADRVIWAGLGRVPNSRVDVPTIVVEFVSKRSQDRVRDYQEKRVEYLEVGVKEYWVIDRFQRKMTIFRRPVDGPEEVVLPADGIYRTPLLPGFDLPLAELLEVADDWSEPAR